MEYQCKMCGWAGNQVLKGARCPVCKKYVKVLRTAIDQIRDMKLLGAYNGLSLEELQKLKLLKEMKII